MALVPGSLVSGSLVLGVDSSTQSTKVEARDIETGRVVARGERVMPRPSLRSRSKIQIAGGRR